MASLENVSKMSLSEYCDFLETRSFHTCVDVFELNMHYHIELGAISMERYERAKAELIGRRADCD